MKAVALEQGEVVHQSEQEGVGTFNPCFGDKQRDTGEGTIWEGIVTDGEVGHCRWLKQSLGLTFLPLDLRLRVISSFLGQLKRHPCVP